MSKPLFPDKAEIARKEYLELNGYTEERLKEIEETENPGQFDPVVSSH